MTTWKLCLEELEARIAPDAVDTSATEAILRLPGSGGGDADTEPEEVRGEGHGAAKNHEDTFIQM